MIKECLFFHLNRKYLKVRCPITLCYVAQTLLMEITQTSKRSNDYLNSYQVFQPCFRK